MKPTKIYDISQEVFTCEVYPGDPAPEKQILASIKQKDLYNLTAFSMCAHNGTHIDAPYHFIDGGQTVDELSLSSTVGFAFVAEFNGVLTKDDAAAILEKAHSFSPEAAKRILLKGKLEVSFEAAKVFADAHILLLGNESQTVGPEHAPMQVHLELLGKGAVVLEGIRLCDVSEGVFFLFAAPLSLAGADGAPCRAVLVKFE